MSILTLLDINLFGAMDHIHRRNIGAMPAINGSTLDHRRSSSVCADLLGVEGSRASLPCVGVFMTLRARLLASTSRSICRLTPTARATPISTGSFRKPSADWISAKGRTGPMSATSKTPAICTSRWWIPFRRTSSRLPSVVTAISDISHSVPPRPAVAICSMLANSPATMVPDQFRTIGTTGHLAVAECCRFSPTCRM